MATGSSLKSQKELPAEISQKSETNTEVRSNNKLVSNDHFEKLIEENNRNKKRLKHMEGIGAVVAATSEQNFELQRDNDQLRGRVDALTSELEMLRQQIEQKSEDKLLESRALSPASSSGYEMVESSASDDGEGTRQKLPKHTYQNNDKFRQSPTPRLPNLRERLVKAESMDSMATSIDPELREMQSFVEHLRSNPPEQTSDKSKASQHHREHQSPLSRHSSADEQTANGCNMSSQFEKSLGMVTRVLERELKYKKKVKTTQAFCDALMLENDSLKRNNKDMSEKLQNKDSEINRLKYELTTTNMELDDMRLQRTTNPLEFYQRTDDGLTNLPNEEVSYFSKLQSRIKKLERQRAEVLGVNKQWDTKYKKDIDSLNSHIVKLKDENKILKTLSESSQGRKRNNVDMLLLEARKQIDSLKQEKNNLAQNFAMEHRKCKELKERSTQLEKELCNVTAENKRLSQALEVAYGTGSIGGGDESKVTVSLYDSVAPPMNPPTTSCATPVVSVAAVEGEQQNGDGAACASDEYKTEVGLLAQQVKIYQEDFETERRDREKSQSEKQELEERLKNMAQEIQALTEQVKINEQDFRQERRDKKKLQRQMERIQQHSSAPAAPVRHHSDVYYSREEYAPLQTSDDLRQYSTSDNYHGGRNRYPRTSGRPLPPPYTHDTSRTIPPRRIIRNGYLERSNDISYPPNSANNDRY